MIKGLSKSSKARVGESGGLLRDWADRDSWPIIVRELAEEEKGSWTIDLDLEEAGRGDASEPRLDMMATRRRLP